MASWTFTAQALWEISRPRQWIKNAFVFAPLLFAKRAMDPVALERSGLAFLLFCLFSSCVYMINDVADLERDRQHPQKKTRPLPSGRIQAATVLTACAALLAVAVTGAVLLSWEFAGVGLAYLLIHVVYSFWAKSAVILDGMLIASGFVLRTYAGAVVIDVIFSDWLYICALFVSLFLAFSKRRHEIILLGEEEARNHREILQEYSTQLLDQIIAIVTAATVVSYSLYCIDTTSVKEQTLTGKAFSAPVSPDKENPGPPPANPHGSLGYNPRMKYTIPFVIYGLFRYLYLIYRKEEGGNPTELLLSDKPLLLNGMGWLLAVFWALNYA
ncbi:MAG: decaprenyl-phosphate phosphoribosyltransferase [Candidatus Omnitrophica bacterium]|nr:decaprenyl-phosphate phosphoribosyltransferase [Candidatus Omnitrophota bacterium]